MDTRLNQQCELEWTALESAASQELTTKHLRTVLEGLAELPFHSTHSLRRMLDYLAQAPAFRNQWKAVQLKMGIWLVNPYARMAWWILMTSVLYTWELVAKFRKPIRSMCNIYYRQTASMGRGPDVHDSEQNFLLFRDRDWISSDEEMDGLMQDPDSEAVVWYGVLSHISRRMPKEDAVDKFLSFASRHEIFQFAPVPQSPLPKKKKDKVTYLKEGVTNLSALEWHLLPSIRWRPVRFGSVFKEDCNRFSFYYRYYVFSTTTGHDYLFYYDTTDSAESTIYPHAPRLKTQHLFTRSDTCGVLEWYLNVAHYRTGRLQRVVFKTDPLSDLAVMQEFWAKYHDGQDTITLCLEVQQRLLYERKRWQLIERTGAAVAQIQAFSKLNRWKHDRQTAEFLTFA